MANDPLDTGSSPLPRRLADVGSAVRRNVWVLALPTILVLWGLLPAEALHAQSLQNQNPHGPLPDGLSCQNCHSPDGWAPALSPMDFDHGTMTRFPLLGRHDGVACQSCHLDLVFAEPALIGDGCESCHVDVHQGAFSQSCTDCHNQSDFTVVDGQQIHLRTGFTLLGAHEQVTCESCHSDASGGHFATLGTACMDCHEQEYVEAETIDHVESGFSTQCLDCHTMRAWQPAQFDHLTASGGFALLGAHMQVDCASCHEIPSMETLFNAESDQDCYACHAEDYADEHAGSGFPTQCLLCHNMNTWDDAEFADHDRLYFPIFSGEHKGVWDSCQTCHTVPSDFTQFSCIDCHEHNQPDMDREHRGVSGYIYQSEACLSCHPTGSEDDAEGGDDD